MARDAVYEPINADITYRQSTWKAHPRWTSDMFHGKLYPVQVLEMLPGDRFSADMRHFTRMSAPIAPVFGDFYQHVAVFFVPKRILWDKTKQFYGEAESFGVATEVKEPTTDIGTTCISRASNDITKWMTFANAFGLVFEGSGSGDKSHINLLPVRGFMSIYNEYYRNENYQAKYMWDKTQTGFANSRYFATRDGVSVGGTTSLPSVNKIDDLFTRILPYQLKSNDPVSVSVSGSIGISDDGPIVFIQKNSSGQAFPGNYGLVPAVPVDGSDGFVLGASDHSQYHLSDLTGYTSGRTFTPFLQNFGGSASAVPQFEEDDDGPSATGYPLRYYNGLKASSALTTSLNDLIYALSYQYFLSRLARGGSKYGEYIENIFGVKCPAAIRDEPEFLGHVSWRLNVDTVVQTTGHADGDTSTLGQVGGNSQTGGQGSLFNYACSEPGYLYVLTYTKHSRSYSSGINPIFLKEELLDYYQTPFANMPDVSLDRANLWFTGYISNDKQSLGFVEPFIDYKRFPDRVFGMMNPMNPGSSDFWTTGEKFANVPTINGAFLVEDRSIISRVLTSGTSGPDYISDIILDMTISRVMPLYSTGLGKM